MKSLSPTPDLLPSNDSALLEPTSSLPSESIVTSVELSNSVSSADVSSQESSLGWRKEFQIFASTFLTIFLAEMGDKTQLTTLLMTAESHSPWIIFAGAGAALILTSILGVSLGHWLSQRIAPRTLEVAAGSLLLGIAALLIIDIVRGL